MKRFVLEVRMDPRKLTFGGARRLHEEFEEAVKAACFGETEGIVSDAHEFSGSWVVTD